MVQSINSYLITLNQYLSQVAISYEDHTYTLETIPYKLVYQKTNLTTLGTVKIGTT